MTPPAADPAIDESESVTDRTPKEEVNWWHELRGLALMLLAVLAFHTFVAKPFYIPSGSMMPNLLVGDRLVVSKWPYGWSWVSASFHVLPRDDWRIKPATPEYGDIVIVVPPDRNEDYIKRVVALPGDTFALDGGQIILNGREVPRSVEPRVRLAEDSQVCDGRPCMEEFYRYRRLLPSGEVVFEPPTFRETMPNGASYLVIDDDGAGRDNFDQITVPEGHVFLMGDNRDHSADSRFASGFPERGLGGPVPIHDIGGRAEFLTFSLDGSASWNPLTWWKSLRPDRAWTTLRPELGGSVTGDE